MDRAPVPRIDDATWYAMLQLRLDGTAGTPVTARPGDSVRLEAVVASTAMQQEFSWYTTAGSFASDGITLASAVH